MDLAITLLLTLALASIIGTVLKQNQPYPDYLIKFGPYWFDVFEKAGLYDIYSSVWFLLILTLLVLSTTVCVIRHTPSMLKDMWQLRTHIQQKSLKLMHHSQQWYSPKSVTVLVPAIHTVIQKQGFRTKVTTQGSAQLISAMRGGLNRLGYIFTHVAIIIICLGGLLDSNLYLKIAEWQGKIQIETRDIPTKDIPAKSRLPVGKQAFRGSVNIPEGRSSNVVFLAMRDGYLVQELPFKVEVTDFRIEHYATGQPKSFESDLVIYDKDLPKPLKTTISVNHPFFYKGYAIYQASFSDGGSKLTIQAWPLTGASLKNGKPPQFQARVFGQQTMQWGDVTYQLEMMAFRQFNINPDPTKDDPKHVRNFGPSFTYKLRKPTGEAKEYMNYMWPVTREGRSYFLSGVRSSPAEAFRFLYLPLDENGSLKRFSQFLTKLHSPTLVEKIARTMAEETLSAIKQDDKAVRQNLQAILTELVRIFVQGGFDAVGEYIDTNLPEKQKQDLGRAYMSMLRDMLARLFFSDYSQQDLAQISGQDALFLQDAVNAVGSLSRYDAPVYLQLVDYKQVQASGLQIAHSPGKPVVYAGCALLVIGVFLLFYVPQRRVWVYMQTEGDGTDIIVAGMSNRHTREASQYFSDISEKIKAIAPGT